ncbi:FxSxx-COOH system tetratricopeptide repeat protein [Rugosimonospora africana]|uniref:NTPase n=1 Tax=Rugosimonospora africana TaxID=556532 RepID=A0A8J3QR63_9ACTN|nr:FxSxx-COOH system tetratricopeptide repeat protein [Rugosimonospora africana]GIH15079.1 NTPase [Rugosimonospora africana]
MTDRGRTEATRAPAPVVVTFATVRGDNAPASGDVGLAGIVANTAVALSGVDRSVLVLDSGAGGGLVLDFLAPFLIGPSDATDNLDPEGARMAGRFADEPLTLFRHASPTGRGLIDVLGPFHSFPRIIGDDLDGGPGGELRAILRRTPYDVVLLGMTAETEPQVRLIADLSDKVAMCFAPQYSRIRDAAKAAVGIRDAAIAPPRTIAVTSFDASMAPRANQTISDVRQQFSVLGPTLDDRIVRVPGHSGPRALGLLLEDPAQRRPAGAIEAYGELLSFILDGHTAALTRTPRAVRERYRRGLAGRPLRTEMRAIVVYAPADRPWADWAGEQLRNAGFRVGAWPADQDWLDDRVACTLVVIGSGAFSVSTTSVSITDVVRARTDVDAVLVQVEPGGADAYPAARPIDLTTAVEFEGTRRLLAGLGLADAGLESDGREPRYRYPRSVVAVRAATLSVPRRSELIGRNDYLEQIRDALVDSAAVGLVVLDGDGGAGKSAIAQEYAHRFAYDYDVIWWIAATDQQSVRTSLARLGYAMGVEPSADMVAATFEALRLSPPGRTLLVYDAADDLAAVAGLLPINSDGHVIVTAATTTTGTVLAVPYRTLWLDSFEPAEAVAVLRTYAPALPMREADALIAATDPLPLSLHLVGALIRHSAGHAEMDRGFSASEAAARAADDVRRQLPDRSFAAILGITLTTLDEHDATTRLTRRLAELCCFLDPARISLSLLRWPAMVEQLAAAAGIDARSLLDEPLDLDQVIWVGHELGIFSVFWGAGAELRMHGLVRSLIRDAMSPEERAQRQRQAALGLAGYAAGRLRDPGVLAELRPHLLPSGALTSTEWPVRRWVQEQLRWISEDDDVVARTGTLRMVEEALRAWSLDGDPTEKLILQLATWRADLQRMMGLPHLSLVNDRELLELAVEVHGPRSVRALTARRGSSGDLRGLGEFDQALVLDQRTWRQFRDQFGDDHPQTLAAAHNLATSYFLAGAPELALRHEQDTLDRRLALFGKDQSLTWWSMAHTAAYQRELGLYAEASRQLYDALDRVRVSRAANHPDVLRIKGQLAIAERRLGRYAVARQLDWDGLNGYRHAFGSNHPSTRACQLSLAMDQYYLGEFTTALQLAGECLAGYESSLPAGHPFIEVCRADLALVSWSADRAPAARDLAAQATEGLEARLGDAHPWVLATQLNVAGMNPDTSPGELRHILELCRAFLHPGHPYTQAAADAAARAPGDTAVAFIDIDVPEV